MTNFGKAMGRKDHFSNPKKKKKKKKKKKTPAVKFLDLNFHNNFFVFNFSKMCSR